MLAGTTPPSTPPATPGTDVSEAPDDEPVTVPGKKGLLSRNPAWSTAAAYAFVPLFATIAGMQMWEWGDTTHFKMGHDGWMERSQTHGGADKTGHAFGFFMGARLWTWYFDHVYPENHRKAAFLGAGLSWLGSVCVEIGDGFASDYGFSWTDMAFNTAGVLLALAMELWPSLDNLVDFSFHHWPTPGFLSPSNKNKLDIATDYSAQLFTLHLRLGGIPLLADNNPLRFLRLDVGYFTRCYEVNDGCSKENTGTPAHETRNLYFGISLDIARMIREHRSRNSPVQYFGTFTRYYNLSGFFPMGFNVDINAGGKVHFGTSTRSVMH